MGLYNTVGNNRYVSMIVAAAGNKNPPKPCYEDTWDVRAVFRLFKGWGNNLQLSLKYLTLKLVMLLLLCTAQRGQTIWRLPISGLVFTDVGVVFRMKHQLKHDKPGDHLNTIPVYSYREDSDLCPVRCLCAYLRKTEEFRGNTDQLLLATIEPHEAVKRCTISNWVKQVLVLAGIDTNKYKSHSTRAAATSMAAQKGINVNRLLRQASWKNEMTFGRFYNKPIESIEESVTHTLLKNV